MKTIPLITSTENKYYQLFKSLNESKFLKKEKSFLVSGSKLVVEFIKKDPMAIKAVLSTEEQNPFLGHNNTDANSHSLNDKNNFPNSNSISNNPNSNSVSKYNTHELFGLIQNIKHLQYFQLSKNLMKDIDSLGTHSPMLWVDQKEIPEWNPHEYFEGLELICPLGDPQNLGAVIRSGWALGASRVVLLQESANPFLPKCWKSSAGTIWDMPLVKGPSINELKVPLYALDMQGENLEKFQWPRHTRLLLGEEGQGLPSHLDVSKISIPMKNNVESLNVAVAASLAIATYSRNK